MADSGGSLSRSTVGLSEHKRLFRFQPSKETKRKKESGRNAPNPKRGSEVLQHGRTPSASAVVISSLSLY